jgi:hypothetical protein
MTQEKKAKKEKTPRTKTISWLPQMFIKPRATMEKVAAAEESIKRTPMLFIIIIMIVAILFAAPVKRVQLAQGATIPENFQYWSEQQQLQYFEAQKNQASPIFMYLFPTLAGALGYFLFSLIMASILYLALTLAGSRAPRLKIGNVVAWAMIPFGLRELIKFIVAVTSKQLITQPGFSNLIDAEAKGFLAYLRSLLAEIDIYWVLFVVFLVIGAIVVSGLKKRNAIVTTIIGALIMLLLQGVPGFIGSLLRGLSAGGAGFYF